MTTRHDDHVYHRHKIISGVNLEWVLPGSFYCREHIFQLVRDQLVS